MSSNWLTSKSQEFSKLIKRNLTTCCGIAKLRVTKFNQSDQHSWNKRCNPYPINAIISKLKNTIIHSYSFSEKCWQTNVQSQRERLFDESRELSQLYLWQEIKKESSATAVALKAPSAELSISQPDFYPKVVRQKPRHVILVVKETTVRIVITKQSYFISKSSRSLKGNIRSATLLKSKLRPWWDTIQLYGQNSGP